MASGKTRISLARRWVKDAPGWPVARNSISRFQPWELPGVNDGHESITMLGNPTARNGAYPIGELGGILWKLGVLAGCDSAGKVSGGNLAGESLGPNVRESGLVAALAP